MFQPRLSRRSQDLNPQNFGHNLLWITKAGLFIILGTRNETWDSITEFQEFERRKKCPFVKTDAEHSRQWKRNKIRLESQTNLRWRWYLGQRFESSSLFSAGSQAGPSYCRSWRIIGHWPKIIRFYDSLLVTHETHIFPKSTRVIPVIAIDEIGHTIGEHAALEIQFYAR